jgi:hypothetical protein
VQTDGRHLAQVDALGRKRVLDADVELTGDLGVVHDVAESASGLGHVALGPG